MDGAQEIEVELPGEADIEAPNPDTKDTEFQALKKQLDEANEGREKALRRAEEAERVAAERSDLANRSMAEKQGLEVQARTSKKQAIETGIASAKSESERLAGDLARLHEEGKFVEAAQIQRKLSRVEAEQLELERYHHEIEVASRAPAPDKAPLVETRPADPVEAFIQGAKLTRETAAWVRSHPDAVTDDVTNAAVMLAHKKAVRDGLKPDSKDYFAFIEREAGFAPPDGEAEQPAAKAPQRQAPAAPVSRSTERASGNMSATKVKLSAGEVQAATDGTLKYLYGPKKGQPIGVEEFARRKAKMQADGHYRG